MILNLTKMYPKASNFFEDEHVASRDLRDEELEQLTAYFKGFDRFVPDREFRHLETVLSKFGPNSSGMSSGDVVVMGDDIVMIDLLLEQTHIGRDKVVKAIVSVPEKERFGGGTFARA